MHTPSKFNFDKLPKATQVMFIIIKKMVDKRAFIDYKTGHIMYTERSNPKLKRHLTGGEAWRIFSELYIEA